MKKIKKRVSSSDEMALRVVTPVEPFTCTVCKTLLTIKEEICYNKRCGPGVCRIYQCPQGCLQF
jgi:hypothetical protein